MAITTKTRKDLKAYFVKNAIPLEANFAEMIEASLNQADDGVFKLAGEPLSVVAAAGGQKRVLRFYSDYPTANADWLISLNPAQNPADAATNRPGFGIADGAGNTRLFLDPTGKLGLGTNQPGGAIDVRIEGSNDPWHRFVVTTAPNWGDANAKHVMIGAGGANGIMFSNPYVAWTGDRATIRYGRTGGAAGQTYWDVGVRSDGRFGFTALDSGGGGEQVVISKEGLLNAKAGVSVLGAVNHIETDGSFYRHNDGQVYLTVDDNLYIRDQGAGSWAAHFDTNTGTLNLKGTLNAATGVKASGNGGVLDLEGNDHAYIEFFPQKLSAGRKGWIGYGNVNSNSLAITSEAGDLQLTGSSVTVRGGLAVNDSSNTGVARGLYLWSPGDTNHVIYSSNPQGKSPANATPPSGFFNGGHRMRFRTYATGQGFLFENHLEQAMVDITADTGELWTRGKATLGGGLTVTRGQPVAGVPVTLFRTIVLRRGQTGWRNPVPGQWVWEWNETYDFNLTGGWVALGASSLHWGREAALKGQQLQAQVTGVSGRNISIRATFGWYDFTGNWDDALWDGCTLEVLVVAQMNTAV
jgi:hypothetical protein